MVPGTAVRRGSTGSLRNSPRTNRSRGGTPNRSRPTSRASSNSPSRRVNAQRRIDVSVDDVYDRITSATNRLTDCNISQFTGSKEQDVEDWLQQFEDLSLARRWDETTKKEQLPTFFAGTARRWLANRQEGPSMFRDADTRNPIRGQKYWNELTWKEAKLEIEAHFLPQGYKDHLYARLNRPQKKGEDIICFYDDKVYVANRLGKTAAETIRAIKRTLLPEYLQLTGVTRDFDLFELLANLKEADLVIQKSQRSRKTTEERPHFPVRGRRDGRSNIPVKVDRNPRRCYNCYGYGHLSRDCRAPQPLRDQRRNFEPPTRRFNNYRQEPPTTNVYPTGGTNRPINDFARNFDRPANSQFRSHDRPTNPQVSGYNQQTNRPNNYGRHVSAPPVRPALQYEVEERDDWESREIDEQIIGIKSIRIGPQEPEYLLPVEVGTLTVDGLLDTGACMSCMEYNLFRKCCSTTPMMAPEGLVIQGVGDSRIEPVGVASVTYGYYDQSGKKHEVEILTVILSELRHKLIIGRDFTYRTNLKLDTENRSVRCEAPRPARAPQTKLVYGKVDTEIPARSIAIMQVDVSGIVEPLEGVVG